MPNSPPISKENEMKVALRPALPLLIGIALAAVLALLAMHSLTFGTVAAPVGSHHSVAYAAHDHEAHDHASTGTHDHAGAAADALAATATHALASAGTHALPSAATHALASTGTHDHGASSACTSTAEHECCSSLAKGSSAPTITLHAFPGTAFSAVAASLPVASLRATEAAERPPARALLSVIRV
jgi:hypothetical protein